MGKYFESSNGALGFWGFILWGAGGLLALPAQEVAAGYGPKLTRVDEVHVVDLADLSARVALIGDGGAGDLALVFAALSGGALLGLSGLALWMAAMMRAARAGPLMATLLSLPLGVAIVARLQMYPALFFAHELGSERLLGLSNGTKTAAFAAEPFLFLSLFAALMVAWLGPAGSPAPEPDHCT